MDGIFVGANSLTEPLPAGRIRTRLPKLAGATIGESDIGESAIVQGSNFANKRRFGTEIVQVLRSGEFLNCPLSPVFIMDYKQVWLAKHHGPDWVEGRTKPFAVAVEVVAPEKAKRPGRPHSGPSRRRIGTHGRQSPPRLTWRPPMTKIRISGTEFSSMRLRRRSDDASHWRCDLMGFAEYPAISADQQRT